LRETETERARTGASRERGGGRSRLPASRGPDRERA